MSFVSVSMLRLLRSICYSMHSREDVFGYFLFHVEGNFFPIAFVV
jgi:hypothetical protein